MNKPKRPAPPGLTPLTESISLTELEQQEKALEAEKARKQGRKPVAPPLLRERDGQPAGSKPLEITFGAMDETLPGDVRRRGPRAPESERVDIPGRPIRERRADAAHGLGATQAAKRQPFWWKLAYWSLGILLSSGVTLYLMQTGNLVYLVPALVVLAIVAYLALRNE